jgi:acyl-CoA reductase-like NAD-dependent aldehyde dehydrogenase
MSQPAEQLSSSSRTTIVCSDPATGQVLGEVPALTPEQVRERVVRAREAQASWARTSFAQRREVLRRMLDLMLEQADTLCEQICRDIGKTPKHAVIGELWPLAAKLRWTIAHGEAHLRSETVSPGVLQHKRARIEYHPLGVIGVITPWNFPLQNILATAIPALFAGNAVIVKVSEWSSWSAEPFQEFFNQCLSDCGHSPDLIQIITGYAETGAALVSGGVDKVVFTGSIRSGRRVLEESIKTLTPVILQLSGKDPMIVCDDADLDQAVHAAISGAFLSAGQMCLAAERILVFDGIYDEFVRRVKDITRGLQQGDPCAGKPVDLGPMTIPTQVDNVERLVRDALDKGASLEAGGSRASKLGTHYFEPTVLAGVTEDMRIMQEVTFGPIMAIVRVANEDEAVRVANGTEYGLSSSVFSKDPARARRIADRIVAGSTCINDWALMYMVQDLPYGGIKNSGFGRLNGRDGLRTFTNVKSVIEDRWPIHLPLALFPSQDHDYEVIRESVRLLYSRRIGRKFDALLALGKALRKRVF